MAVAYTNGFLAAFRNSFGMARTVFWITDIISKPLQREVVSGKIISNYLRNYKEEKTASGSTERILI
jgi:hypothetical protein